MDMENNNTGQNTIRLPEFDEVRNNPEYTKWLEEVLIALFRENRGTAQKADRKIKKLGLNREFTDDLLILIEDRDRREKNPELRDYPLNLVDPTFESREENALVNDWEIIFIAEYADKFTGTEQTGIRSDRYGEFLGGLAPYWHLFTELTQKRLIEEEIAPYCSYRKDKNIPWHECGPENIYYNLDLLMNDGPREEQYLFRETNLCEPQWRNLRAQMS